MAKIFGKDFGLDPAAGSVAKDFADSMDQASKAAEKIKIESKLGYQTITKQLNATQKLTDEAKLNEKILEKKLKDHENYVKQLKDVGANKKIIAEANKKSRDLSKELTKLGKDIKTDEKELTELTKEKGELDKIITKELEKQNKWGNLINISVAALVALGAELLSRQSKVREEMGLTVAQTNKLLPVVQSVTGELAHQGISFEKSSAAAKAIYDSTKNFADVTEENVANVALISQKFGIAVGDTAKIAQTMKEIGGYTMEQSTNMIAFASAAAEVVGVNPKDVMADIANSAETAAKYFGDNPKALAKAAIEARRLGLTLDDMAGVSDKLLDINTNIEAQFTAQVLTGKQYNFDAARRLALEGDIEGATKSILGQMGSIDEFNKMDVIQKKAVADAAGLTVTQLSTSLTKQKAINDMTDEQKAKYEKLLGDMDTANQSEADKLLKQTESLVIQEKFNAGMEQLKETLINNIMPLFEALEPTISKIAGWIGSIAKFLGESKIALGAMVGFATAMAAKSALLAISEMKIAIAKIWGSNMSIGPWGVAGAIAGTTLLGAAIGGIASLQEGGVTTGPTMAMVGDNPSGKEAIIPLEKAGEMGFGGNSALIAKMDELIRVVKTAKPLNIDGNKVGEAIYLGNVQSGAA